MIILIIIALLCTIGFVILKNPYSILYGIVIGILDIIPLIGAGTILVPISIYYMLRGNVFAATIVFIVFIREILKLLPQEENKPIP